MKKHFFFMCAIVGVFVVWGCVARQSVAVGEDSRGKKGKIQYGGGDGRSVENAVIIIGAKDQKESVAAEYQFISNLYGERNKGWRLISQSIVRENGKTFDMLEIVDLKDGSQHFYYFDISGYAWKPKEVTKPFQANGEQP